MINSEDDVRAWVREASGGKARWVEPALGSTPGLPDCWVPLVLKDYEGETCAVETVHLELKCGTISRNMLSYSVRPEQRKQIIAMMDDGVPVGLCVGIKGTTDILFIRPTPQSLQGSFSMLNHELAGDRYHSVRPKAREFWGGVNFIFLNSK